MSGHPPEAAFLEKDSVGTISPKQHVTKAQLCLNGRGGFTYVLAQVEYIVRSDDTFTYLLTPDYGVIDLLDPPDFQGIPGFNLEKRKDVYARENRTPTLIADRAPMQNREDLQQLLRACDMDYWDPLEWLILTPTRYIGDKFWFRAVPEAPMQNPPALDIESAIVNAVNSPQAVAAILKAICESADLAVHGEKLGDSQKSILYRTLMPLYEKMQRRFTRAEKSGSEMPVKAGRKRKPVDELMLREAVSRFHAKEWSAEQAAESLDIGVATFYRRMKELTEIQPKIQ